MSPETELQLLGSFISYVGTLSREGAEVEVESKITLDGMRGEEGGFWGISYGRGGKPLAK